MSRKTKAIDYIDVNSRAIFQKWSESDFLLKTLVDRPMHWQARLFYRALLQAAFRCETRPNLPDDDAQLCALLGGVPTEVWNEHRTAVRQWFTPAEVNSIPVLTHKRLQEDWQRIVDFREEQRAKGKASGKARQKRTTVEPRLNHGSADVEPMLNHVLGIGIRYKEEGIGSMQKEPSHTNQHGLDGLAGASDSKSETLANKSLLDDLKQTYNDTIREYADENQSYRDSAGDYPPQSLRLANNTEEHLAKLQKCGADFSNLSDIDCLTDAFDAWIKARYIPDWEAGNTITYPLAIFCDEYQDYLGRDFLETLTLRAYEAHKSTKKTAELVAGAIGGVSGNDATCDHLVPLDRGGRDAPENIGRAHVHAVL